MGLSSSQARLLHLTGRMHQIEYKAAKLEAQKLQMANQSRRVYQEYEEALEATKIQYKSLNEDASITFRDATVNILQNGCVPGYEGEKSAKQYFLQDMEGRIMVTPTVADYYHLREFNTSQTLNEYLDSILPAELKSTRMVPTGEYNEVLKDPLEIDTFNTIPNGPKQDPIPRDYSRFVENIYKEKPNKVFDDFTHPVDTHTYQADGTTYIDINTVESLEPNKFYLINDLNGLKKLSEISRANSNQGVDSGVTIILNCDDRQLNLTNETWLSIENFGGTFDGNGHVITGLTQSNTEAHGLFNNISSGATVKDVGLKGVNINAYNHVGGIAGVNNGTVDNCYVVGTVNGSMHSGGICGENYGTVSSCNFKGTVSAMDSTYTSPRVCVGGIVGHNGEGQNVTAIVTNCNSKCNVTGVITGGIVGHNSGKTQISGCHAEANDTTKPIASYSGGTHGGYNIMFSSSDIQSRYEGFLAAHKVPDVNPEDNCRNPEKWNYYFYTSTKDAPPGSGQIDILADCSWESNGQTYYLKRQCETIYAGAVIGLSGGTTSISDTSYISDLPPRGDNSRVDAEAYTNIGVTVPSKKDLVSNIFAALMKANNEDITKVKKSDVEGYVDKVYNTGSQADLKMMANVNYYVCKYLSNDLNGITQTFVTGTLATDVIENHGANTNATTGILTDRNRVAQYEGVTFYLGNGKGWDLGGRNGDVTIPNKNVIAQELFYGFQQSGKIETVEYSANNAEYQAILSWLELHSESELADLNDEINNKNWSAIYTKYHSGEKYTLSQTNYPQEKWNFHTKDGTITPVYKKVRDPILEPEDYWELSKPEVAQAAAMWALGQKGVVIIDESQASNYLYLKNILEVGEAVLTTFDPSAAATAFENMTPDEILEMDETKYNEAMNIFNTNVAVETHLQEVADEKNLKKAEAKYEADMRRIDFKDRQYDRELAALDAERNAVKNEMDTLKTVAKDNVDRTFKLFS